MTLKDLKPIDASASEILLNFETTKTEGNKSKTKKYHAIVDMKSQSGCEFKMQIQDSGYFITYKDDGYENEQKYELREGEYVE